MLAYLAVGAALFAYMYLKKDEIHDEHAQVVHKAVVQAGRSASMPVRATTPVVIAPPNPGPVVSAPTGQDNAIAVYSTPNTPFDATATKIVPAQAGMPGAHRDVAPASDMPAGRAKATPIAAMAVVPAQTVLTADPSTPPLQAALAQQATPGYTAVAQPPAPVPMVAAAPPVGDSLVVYTSKAAAPSATDPSPNQPIDSTPVSFVQPLGGPFIIKPPQDCRR